MGKTFTAAPIDLASFGYVEEEYFLEGNAATYDFRGMAGSDQLLALYPTHDDYVNKVTAATAAAQQAGFVLAADAPLVVQEAKAAPIPP